MRSLKQVTTILLCCSFLGGLLFACKATKNKAEKDLTIIIELQPKLDGTYFQKEYSDYRPSAVKRSSRSQNQYRVTFNYIKPDISSLLDRLSKDKNVKSFSVSENDEPTIQLSKNN